MNTAIEQIKLMGLSTTCFTSAVLDLKEKYFNDTTPKEFLIEKINSLTGQTFESDSLVETKYTFAYVIQTAVRIHLNKEDRITGEELLAYSLMKAREHIANYEITETSYMGRDTQQVKKIVVVERVIEQKEGAAVKKIDLAYNIINDNKALPREEIIQLLMTQLNVAQGTANVYMSKVARGVH